MPSGWGGVLHTNSAYFSGSYGKGSQERQEYYKPANINADFQAAYDYARQQELSFYHSFFPEVNNYETFIAKLRELFSKAEGDGERIKSLSNANLNKYVPNINDVVKLQPTYQVVVTGDISERLPFEKLASDNVKVSGVPIYITLNSSTGGVIKEIVNETLGKQRFFPDSPNLKRISEWFGQSLGEKTAQAIGNNVTITKQVPQQKNIKIQGTTAFEVGGFPFKWKKSEIKKYLNGEYGLAEKDKFEQEMRAALIEIKNFIFNTCLQVNNGAKYNGVNILKIAAEQTWSSVVGNGPLITQDFFFEGKNLAKSILGEGGEFQLALLDRYINLVIANTTPSLGKIIGGIVRDGRGQPRSDYQLIVELGGDVGSTILGIQVKNINETHMENINVKTDLDLVAPNLGQGFTDSIANYYFNTDIKAKTGNMEEFLKKYLEVYFWKAMNLNVGEGLNPNHTNTFYWAGGTALVPASEIIESIKNNKMIENPTFEITGSSFKGSSDAGFESLAPDGEPLFTEYWHGNKYIEWNPLFPNYKLYQQLISEVKISTSFNMSQIFLSKQGGRGFFEFLG